MALRGPFRVEKVSSSFLNFHSRTLLYTPGGGAWAVTSSALQAFRARGLQARTRFGDVSEECSDINIDGCVADAARSGKTSL